MSLSGSEFLKHILDEITFLQQNSTDLDLNSFISDEVLKRAFVRSLTIIGEAVKRIPQEIQSSAPQIEWTQIAGMRDKLVHNYLGINYRVVWNVIQYELPELRRSIELLLDSGDSDDITD